MDTDASPSSCRCMPAHAAADAAIIGASCPCERLGQGGQGWGRVPVTSSSHGPEINPLSQQKVAACLRFHTHSLRISCRSSTAGVVFPRRHSKYSNTTRPGTSGKERSHRAPRTPRCSGIRQFAGDPAGLYNDVGAPRVGCSIKPTCANWTVGKIDASLTSIRRGSLSVRGSPTVPPLSQQQQTRSQS